MFRKCCLFLRHNSQQYIFVALGYIHVCGAGQIRGGIFLERSNSKDKVWINNLNFCKSFALKNTVVPLAPQAKRQGPVPLAPLFRKQCVIPLLGL